MARQGRKSTDYFDYFCKSAEFANKAAKYLHESLSDFNVEKFPSQVEAMHTIENSADNMKHEMMIALAKEFIPPIEREDIVSLSHELDNVIDAIEEIMQRVYMYGIRTIRPETLEFTASIIRCCSALSDAAAEFRNFKHSKVLKEKLIEVNNIESEGDALHIKYMRKLFSENDDARMTMIWMSLFEGLEMCFDQCEHATDVMEGVILKNS